MRRALSAVLVAAALSLAPAVSRAEPDDELITIDEVFEAEAADLERDGFVLQTERDGTSLYILDTGNGFYQAILRHNGNPAEIQFVPR